MTITQYFEILSNCENDSCIDKSNQTELSGTLDSGMSFWDAAKKSRKGDCKEEPGTFSYIEWKHNFCLTSAQALLYNHRRIVINLLVSLTVILVFHVFITKLVAHKTTLYETKISIKHFDSPISRYL